MDINKEMLEKAKTAKSVEELITLAKDNGFELNDEEANAYFAKLNQTGELADDELDNVSGGGCGESESRRDCPKCGSEYYGVRYSTDPSWLKCRSCGFTTSNPDF